MRISCCRNNLYSNHIEHFFFNPEMSEFTFMHTFTLHHKLIAAFLGMRPHIYTLTSHYHFATNITCVLTKAILFIAMYDIKSCVLKKNHYLLDITIICYISFRLPFKHLVWVILCWYHRKYNNDLPRFS